MKQKTKISVLIISVAALTLITCYGLDLTGNYLDLAVCIIIIATLGYWRYDNCRRCKELGEEARRLYRMLGGTADVNNLTDEFSLGVGKTVCQFTVSSREGSVKLNCLFTLTKDRSNATNERLKKLIRNFREKESYWEDRVKLVWKNLPGQQYAGTISLEWDTELSDGQLSDVSSFLKDIAAAV